MALCMCYQCRKILDEEKNELDSFRRDLRRKTKRKLEIRRGNEEADAMIEAEYPGWKAEFVLRNHRRKQEQEAKRFR